MLKQYTLVFFLFTACNLFAQEKDEYIIKLNGDTIFSPIKRLTILGNGVVLEINGEKKKFLAEEIVLAHFEGQDWLSIKAGNGFELMHRIKKGELNVFLVETKYRDGGSVTTTKSYYIRHYSQERGSVVGLPDRGKDSEEWNRILSSLPCSCSEYMRKLLQEEEMKPGSQKDYLDLISTYNVSCKDGKVTRVEPVFKRFSESKKNVDSVKIKAGEQIYLTRSPDGTYWTLNPEQVDAANTIVISLLIDKNSFALLQIKNQTNMKFKYKAFTFNFDKNAYVSSKVSAVKENLVYTESWPFSLEHILLTSFELK